MSVKPFLTAIDTGNFGTKGACWQDGKIKTISFRSRVVEGTPGLSLVGESQHPPVFQLAGDPYYVSDTGLSPLDLRKEGQTSPAAKALALTALVKMGFGGKDVMAAMNLPLADFVIKGKGGMLTKNENLISEKREAMKHQSSDDCLTDYDLPRIVKGVVQPEGFAAYVRSCMTDSGEINEPVNMRGFIDIGGGTTEIGIVKRGFELQPNYITIPIGTNDIADALKIRILDKWPEYRAIERSVLDGVIEKGFLKGLKSENHDLREDVDHCKAEVARKIMQEAETRLADYLSVMDKILLIGGGSLQLSGHFNGWELIEHPSNAETYNVEGLLLFLTYLCGLEKSDYEADMPQAEIEI